MRYAAMLLLVLLGLVAHVEAKAWQSCSDQVVGMVSGNRPVMQQQCTWLAGAVAIDPQTRRFVSYWNYANEDEARQVASRACGAQCMAVSFYSDYLYIAAAENDAMGYAERKDEAMAACQIRSEGQRCEIIISAGSGGSAVYWYFNALAYDTSTGQSFSKYGSLRRSEAQARVLDACGNAPSCVTWVFQGNNAAMVMAADGSLHVNGGDSKGQARRAARKVCKDATGDKKECKLVAEAEATLESLPGIPPIPDTFPDDVKKKLQDIMDRF